MRERDYTKLPKWAQDEIAFLKRDLKHVEGKLDALNRGESDAYMLVTRQDEPAAWTEIPLESSHVRWKVNTGTVDVMIRDGQVEVSALDGRILVEPKASNVIRVVPSGFRRET